MVQHQEEHLASDIEALIHKYGATLRLYAKTELGDEDAVDEVLQQAWIDLYHEGIKRGTAWLRSPMIYGWLRRVVHNRIYDYRGQHKTLSLDEEGVIQALDQRTNPLEYPDTIVVRSEMALRILDAIFLDFTPNDMFVILCFYYLEYSIKELAHMLSCPESTIKSQLHRTRKRLRKALEKHEIQMRDINQVGGLREKLEQVLSWLALGAVLGDERDIAVPRTFFSIWSEHPWWMPIADEFLNEWDRGIAERYQICQRPLQRSMLPISPKSSQRGEVSDMSTTSSTEHRAISLEES